MQLYNTPLKRTEPFQPQNPQQTTVYTCGPTVYDYPHIGNWFTFIRYDVLIRSLKANNLHPKWVMNITDVGHLVSDADEGEDKLEKGAKREGKTAWDVAALYGDYFLQGLQRLNITKPDMTPKATDHITEQISLVKQLEANGHTYIIDDGVYFDTSTFPEYATFAGLDLADQQAGARVSYNTEKRNPSDFALWKFSPVGEQRDMEWDSPWGVGFPGWHLECSAMAMKYLGETIDIHGGGIDHIPVHHTNEIAQSQAATGKPFSSIWFHTNHITVDGQKISKSLANGFTLEDIEAKGFSLEAFRLYVLESHYRTQSKFTWEGLQAAHNRLQELRAMAALRYQHRATTNDYATFALEEVPETVKHLLRNDLDTPQALAFLSQVTTQMLAVHLESDMLPHFEAMLDGIDALLGLQLSAIEDITDEQKQRIADRETARENKDWQSADTLRNDLISQGIGLRDTAYGAVWFPL